MTKLREALSTIDSENPHIGAAVRQGDPGSEIVQFARSLPADVIVMGAAGSDRPDRPIGSVTATVVARANCPVLIVPRGRQVDQASPGLFRRILCAVDLAPTSVSVIRQALSLAWETHGHLMVVCVMTEPDPPPADVREHLSAAVPPEARAWCDIELVVKQGVPGHGGRQGRTDVERRCPRNWAAAAVDIHDAVRVGDIALPSRGYARCTAATVARLQTNRRNSWCKWDSTRALRMQAFEIANTRVTGVEGALSGAALQNETCDAPNEMVAVSHPANAQAHWESRAVRMLPQCLTAIR